MPEIRLHFEGMAQDQPPLEIDKLLASLEETRRSLDEAWRGFEGGVPGAETPKPAPEHAQLRKQAQEEGWEAQRRVLQKLFVRARDERHRLDELRAELKRWADEIAARFAALGKAEAELHEARNRFESERLRLEREQLENERRRLERDRLDEDRLRLDRERLDDERRRLDDERRRLDEERRRLSCAPAPMQAVTYVAAPAPAPAAPAPAAPAPASSPAKPAAKAPPEPEAPPLWGAALKER